MSEDYLFHLSKALDAASDDEARTALRSLIDRASGPQTQSGGGPSTPPTNPPTKLA